jgi:dTDP-4-dehydrorhamnose 3,5-epimerase
VQVIATDIADVRILIPKRHQDARGFFCETYNQREFRQAGIDLAFVQDNHSLSVQPNVIRGLHYQVAPHAQHKLVRVLRGAVYDVAVDLRRASATFGRHVRVRLSAADGRQLLVPAGFAHGYITLEPNTEVFYKVTDFYSPAHERGLLWNDPALGIDWGVDAGQAILTDRDRGHPRLVELADLF